MSKTTQHTPGPWRAVSQYDGQPIVMIFAGAGDDSTPVAKAHLPTMLGAAICKEQAEANARLIACCPELLALVEIMRDAMDRGGEFQLGPKGRHAGLRERVQAVLSQVNP